MFNQKINKELQILKKQNIKIKEELKYAEEVCGGVMGICYKCWKPIYGKQKIGVTKDHRHAYHENENDCFKRIGDRI